MGRGVLLPIVVTCALLPAMDTNSQDHQASEDAFAEARAHMVDKQIRRRGVTDPRLLAALESVPRHLFVPENYRAESYDDHPLPIGYDQTISQPYIVALMTDAVRLRGDERVLEIGTGSGYQAAVLSLMAKDVFSIEIVEPLGEQARARLWDLGYRNVEVRVGDGYKGWPEEAPFDAIVVTAAPKKVPQALIDQLADGGRLVVPVGTRHQELLVLTRDGDKIREEKLADVRFVPMVHGDD